MAEGNWSVIRVEKISAEGAQKTERHNERKNESYANLNVDTEQIARNVHFKDTGGLTYNEYFQRLIDEGKISTRGQKAGATVFNELVIDVNTRYFEEHGGYEYARQFYEEAYRLGCEIYGEENIVSAVMHADEINKAVSEELGKPVYHYHLHIVAIPTVRKEILWSKRCKDEALRGTVKEVINQVSHSKKWKNTVPLLDENGQQVISKYGKPMFRKSYSVLQDKLFAHMTEAGFTGFERGVLGSTAENLSSLDYQIQKDKERLAHIQERIEAEQVRYEPAHEVRKTMAEIEGMGQKTITGKIAVSKDDYQQLTALAKEGITSRSEIQDLKSSVSYYQRQYFNASSAVERLQERYDRLKEKCQPFLQALEHFPKLVEVFVEKVKELFSIKEAQEGINLPKKIKKTEYRVLKIDEKKTLTLPQVLRLIEASKETPIHMQILFAVLMGLRRSEINGLKYSDVDYIHRTLRVERQLGKKPNSKAEDCAPKMLTKQEIKTKTPAGVRELPIPDYVFEAILEERKTYEKNRRRRPKEFRDWNYICCSTYGNPRSKGFHQKYYKDLLKSLDLPDIHFHQLRNTYATILLKNSFNSKGVSHLLGHAKEIISVDVYGDTQEIIEDCLDVLEPFIEEVIPKERKDQYYDYSEVIEIDLILEEYFNAA